ncbi:MAG: methionine--tRNA ligase [Candidatus Bipolaricaulota bacterium]|nr:methionine--tRNA ligase [Candidatus Bipolaricaulota bacterium]
MCSAWPYANNVPHLGTLIGCLLSGDVFARYYKLKGHEVVHVSGTDAHGTRMEFEALQRGITPHQLVEQVHQQIVETLQKFDIVLENYTITRSPTHQRFVREIYKKIEANGYIFSKEEERAYCQNCQKFLADSFIVGTCPRCKYDKAYGDQCSQCGAILEAEQLINPQCQICKQSNITFRRTRNWYLDLPKLEPRLRDYVNAHQDWAPNVKNFTEGLLKEGLKPRAVTRDLSWGIPAPFTGAEGKVIYVWAEAALGYVSATIEYFEKKGEPERWRDFWFGDNVKQVYTQGKDNITFHTLIFPGQLLASGEGYHLPDQISATEHLQWIGKQRFSKSQKIGLFSDDALELMDPLYWRFYLLYNRPERKDIEFSWEDVDNAVNGVFINNIGNLLHRIVSLAHRSYGGIYPEANVYPEIFKQIKAVKEEYESIIEGGQLAGALRRVCDLAVLGNEYMQRNRPWEGHKPEVMLTALHLVKAVTILLEPFVPGFSHKAYPMLGMSTPTLDDVLKVEPGAKLGPAQVLLHKVDIKALREKYSQMKAG